MEIMQNIGNEAVLSAILDAYPYQIVLCDRNHIIRYMNKKAAERYNGRIAVGDSIFGCHREDTCRKIEAFLARADAGEDEMFEANNPAKQEREFFTPVRGKSGTVIGYFERHEYYGKLEGHPGGQD